MAPLNRLRQARRSDRGNAVVELAFTLPLLLLSGILLPMSLAPPWLDALSLVNPLRHVVEAMRETFLGRYATPAVFVGLAVAVGTAVLSVAVGTRTFLRENV